MSGKRVVVDTSVLVDVAGGDLIAAKALDQKDVRVSIITCIEFLA